MPHALLVKDHKRKTLLHHAAGSGRAPVVDEVIRALRTAFGQGQHGKKKDRVDTVICIRVLLDVIAFGCAAVAQKSGIVSRQNSHRRVADPALPFSGLPSFNLLREIRD